MKAAINFRQENQLWTLDQVQRYADDQFYAFTRGQTFAAFGNNDNEIKRTITYHPYKNGDKLCNILNGNDCFTVNNAQFEIILNNGEFKLYKK